MSYLGKKRIFCVVFLLVFLTFAVLNAIHTLPLLAESVQEGDSSPAELTELIEENVWQRMTLVETFSLTQAALGKREISDFSIIKDEDGYLHYANFYKERNTRLFEFAHRVRRLSQALANKDTKVIFVATPSKYMKGEVRLERGLKGNDPYAAVQELLLYLYRMDIPTLDMTQVLLESDTPYLSNFFKTDHHWTVPAAFRCAQLLAEMIRENWGDELDPNNFYLNLDNYETVCCRQRMLGSLGRRSGHFFSGMEDFEFYLPKFEGSFRRTSVDSGKSFSYKGNVCESMMMLELLEEDRDIYGRSMYDIYLEGINDYDHIENLQLSETEGPRVLFVSDSYFCPVITLMAPMCSMIDQVYNLYDGEEYSVEALLAENEYDYVIIEVYPYNLDEEAFNYFIRKK